MRTPEAHQTSEDTRNTIKDLNESFVALDATANRIADERNILLASLKRIIQKADIGLREDGGKWAIQTLDSIEEIAQQCLAKLKRE